MQKAGSERGAPLRALRKEAGVSQFRVAAAVGLDPKTISLLELGKVETIRKASAERLAQFFSNALEREINPADLGYQIGRLKKDERN